MRLLHAFLKLIRWPNLVFIILTQVLFFYCIDLPVYHSAYSFPRIIWLILASVLIAAAGYIINDYFDLNIDRINKPSKIIVARIISRRWAIAWHLGLSFFGIITTALAVSFHKWYLIVANFVCILLLWLYSTSFKRKFVIGNVVISLLTAWTVLVIFFAEVSFRASFEATNPAIIRFFKISFLYGSFAFVISLIREAIKDVEDIRGDAKYACTTLPIVAGIRATKIYIGVWLVVLIASLLILQLYLLQLHWWLAVVYNTAFILIPLFYFFKQLYSAKKTGDYAYLSRIAKWIMLTGILSMFFFKLYF